MAPLTITVQGESTIDRPAERAVVSINVHSEGNSQEEVSRQVTHAAAELRRMLEGMSGKTSAGPWVSESLTPRMEVIQPLLNGEIYDK